MKYYIIAGEASGDLHGSNLIRALLALDPEAVIRYWGGDEMDAACAAVRGRCQRVKHIKDLAYMGFVEVIAHLSAVVGNIVFCRRDILGFAPDAVIYIDYPGFNLKIARFAKRHGFRNFHYISPQLWAWKKGRIRSLRRDLDRLFYILPFEQQFYANNRLPQAVFVGHPLLDAVGRFVSAADASCRPPTGAADSRPLIALLPGSRKQELRRMLPPMLRLAAAHPEYRFVVAGMSLLGREFYNSLIPADADNVSVLFDSTYPLLASAYAALVCSGTATLETALFNVPQVVCYRANALSIAIARRFVARRVKYISLVNLIADRPVVAELIQDDLSPVALECEFSRITSDIDARQRMLHDYGDVRRLLGNEGASSRVASAVLSALMH